MINKPPYVRVKRINLAGRREYIVYYGLLFIGVIQDYKGTQSIKILFVNPVVMGQLGYQFCYIIKLKTNGEGLQILYKIAEDYRKVDKFANIDVASLYPKL